MALAYLLQSFRKEAFFLLIVNLERHALQRSNLLIDVFNCLISELRHVLWRSFLRGQKHASYTLSNVNGDVKLRLDVVGHRPLWKTVNLC